MKGQEGSYMRVRGRVRVQMSARERSKGRMRVSQMACENGLISACERAHANEGV